MKIPHFLDKDDYLQNPIMRRFLKSHNIELVENRADYIKAIEEFAAENDENKKETRDWLLKVAKEGSKEICYRKIHGIGERHRDSALVEARIKEVYPDCPMKNILTYKNTGERIMIEYHIITNDDDEVIKIDFTFSKLFLYGESGKMGDVTVFPIFIEVYLDAGFVISRGKAKSTLYKYDENNHFLVGDDKVDTMSYAVSAIDEIISVFGFEAETNKKIVNNENSQMLYKIYEQYSFTPADVVEKVESQNDLVNGFVNQIFSNLNLDVRNKGKAMLDAKIFVEKFISINGNNEDIFKEDRPAYLIKVTADDEIELTKIDTTSDKKVPLQCTEAFFDSKKSVVKSKKCKRLNLIFKRTDETYFSKNNPLVVQLGTHKNHGYAKLCNMRRRLIYKMFYKQFSIITDILNPEFVENFDYWLATLPKNNQKNITASVVSSRLEVKYSLAEVILKFAEKQKILEKYYLVKCPDCDYNLETITKDELADVLINPIYCDECEEEKHISLEDVYTAYKVILQPDVTEDEIERAIEKRLNQGGGANINFSKADSLSNDINTLCEVFYNPSESAYDKFKELRTELDLDYGKNTTAKGKALEALALEIFNQIKGVRGTNDVKTETNQFDCTCLSSINTTFPSVFSYMAPYFIIECKNEKEKPNNTYTNKLLSIMDTNEAQLGIVVGRKDATEPCFKISREHYLKHMDSRKQQIILTFSDNDLKKIIDEKVNLLEYLEYKIFQVTANSPDSTYEMFRGKAE